MRNSIPRWGSYDPPATLCLTILANIGIATDPRQWPNGRSTPTAAADDTDH